MRSRERRPAGRRRREPPFHPAADLIRRLRQRIDGVLGGLLDGISDVALLDFPGYPNVGDSAIWLGERRWLREAGVHVRYTADMHTFTPTLLRSRLPGGAILLQGGGNFGDLWAAPQRFREQVISTFRDRRIIVLPQTIWFQQRSEMDRARRIFDAHPDLTLLLRDQPSLELARAYFQCRSLLCPDMAFALGPLRRAGAPESGVLRVLRTDVERAGNRSDPDVPQGPTADWIDHSDRLTDRLPRALRSALSDRPTTYPLTWRLIGLLGEFHAHMRLRHGIQLLSRAETVVTDRLHGHILCLLLGIPHFLMDNSYGKIGAFHRTWTQGCTLVVGFGANDDAGDREAAGQA